MVSRMGIEPTVPTALAGNTALPVVYAIEGTSGCPGRSLYTHVPDRVVLPLGEVPGTLRSY